MHCVVKTTVFPKCKLPETRNFSMVTGAIARAIVKDFGIKDYNDPVSIRWWEGHKDLANKSLEHIETTVSRQCQNATRVRCKTPALLV